MSNSRYHLTMVRMGLFIFLLMSLSFGNIQYFSKYNNESTVEVDYQIFGEFLSKYVFEETEDGVSRFDYKAVRQEDKEKLDQFIEKMSEIKITDISKSEQIAYWINLYNAVTVQVILDHYPVESIRDISYSWFTSGPWKKKLIRVENIDLSLDNIEHDILRVFWKDPRIHYMVNCASIGCPNIYKSPITGKNYDKKATDFAKKYIQSLRGVQIKGEKLIVSNLYEWYRDDFGKNDREVIEHFLKYSNDDLKERLKNRTKIDGYEYDWSLNEVK